MLIERLNKFICNSQFKLKNFTTTTNTSIYQSIRKMSLKITEIEGDLFSAPVDVSLANCVAADFDMSAGIAVKFRHIFNSIDQLKGSNVKTGGVAHIQHNKRFVYYLVTKEQSIDKPTYETLATSLTAMKNHMIENNVKKLAMPRIGCGIDGLEWDKVKEKLTAILKDTNAEITIYNFVPK